MKRLATRLALLTILAGIVSFSGASGAAAKAAHSDFIPCPVPSCLAPCFFPPPPQVLCKVGDQDPFVTSYTCCCCGSSQGVYYRPL